jgi:pectate lyase
MRSHRPLGVLGVVLAQLSCGEQETGAPAAQSTAGRAAGDAGAGRGGANQAMGATGGDASSGASGRAGAQSGGTGGTHVAGSAGVTTEEVRAFPGAEGFAARVTGGRNGQVLKVTTLAASGPGSLQAALDTPGPRIIVFAVSGVIHAETIEIAHGDVTIAGQTAPGGGITIAARLLGAYDASVGNIIIRHVRIRPAYTGSPGEQFDSIQLSRNHHVMLDHISVGFGVDETVDLYEASDVTLQWSTIESSGTAGHPEGEHNYGLINGPDGRRVSVHHNLFAHHKNRCPAIANGPAEMVNNVVYDARHGFVHHNPASGSFNLIGNYFKQGPEDTLIPFYFDDENASPASDLAYFLRGNVLSGAGAQCPEGSVDDPWSTCDYQPQGDPSLKVPGAFVFASAGDAYRAVTTSDAASAYATVLASAGAFPRDVVALRSVSETQAGSGSWGARYPADLFAGLAPDTEPLDDDQDGMADAWESAHGLNPADGRDHRTELASGYTAIEQYVNELADELLKSHP